jgi:hypothetical protein
MKFNITPQHLRIAEQSRFFSQGGQDGILRAIFNQIGSGKKRYIEFGARDGVECSNTANLRKNYGWSGLLMDAEPLSDWVRREIITAENINDLLTYYCCTEVDYLSIDTDGNDYYIWQAMSSMPRVVTIEYNSKFRNDESVSIEYNRNHKWEGDDYYGASLLAFKKLGDRKGYTLVYVVAQLDAVFIRNDLIAQDYIPPTLDELLPAPIIAHDKVSNKKWIQV